MYTASTTDWIAAGDYLLSRLFLPSTTGVLKQSLLEAVQIVVEELEKVCPRLTLKTVQRALITASSSSAFSSLPMTCSRLKSPSITLSDGRPSGSI